MIKWWYAPHWMLIWRRLTVTLSRPVHSQICAGGLEFTMAYEHTLQVTLERSTLLPGLCWAFPPESSKTPWGLPLPAHNMTDTPTFTLSLQGWPTSTGVLWPQGVTLQSRQPATARGREWNVHQGSASLFKIFHSQRPAESVTDTDKGVIIQRLKASLLSLFD